MNRPIPDSYVIPNTRLVAGEYPGAKPTPGDRDARDKLSDFIDEGIAAFIDLTAPADGLAPYDPLLAELSAERAIDVAYERLTIRDMGVCKPPHMRRVLDTIDAHLAQGRGVYVHCWGGIGRTGTVVGCWLVRHGETGEAALAQVQAHFESMSTEKVRHHRRDGSPQTHEQREMVRTWAAHEIAADPSPAAETLELDKPTDVSPSSPAASSVTITSHRTDATTLDRFRGALLGPAAGDALGTTLEFTHPGDFEPISDMVGGGPFSLDPGQWTDDTSMALCLAESLVERQGFDARDQMERYVRWWKEGYWSSRERCFDIGNTTSAALRRFTQDGNPFAGRTSDNAAGNGSLMRLAPVPLFFAHDADLAIRMAGESSRTTHGAPAAVDACRYFAGPLLGAIADVTKETLLSPSYTPVPGLGSREPLHSAVAEVANGSFHRKSPPAIKGGQGYVIDTLEAALWAFATTDDFESGALAAVNLGGDADTTGAAYGQIAGAYYSVAAIPARWLTRLARMDDLDLLAKRLFDLKRAQ